MSDQLNPFLMKLAFNEPLLRFCDDCNILLNGQDQELLGCPEKYTISLCSTCKENMLKSSATGRISHQHKFEHSIKDSSVDPILQFMEKALQQQERLFISKMNMFENKLQIVLEEFGRTSDNNVISLKNELTEFKILLTRDVLDINIFKEQFNELEADVAALKNKVNP